ncbi:MAG: DUF3445 domain-containing protein [Gammaproteobacteria bacterium]|nr:DUF3445 domain-containing protein [Gammaproteobacteria bacterium]MDH5730778.1 DUF3445 domain-containing protein [Gammaproteobacteria bacterium]
MISLPNSAFYFPIDAKFAFKPGLYKLDKDFGNGEHDRRIFQLDQSWPEYYQQKQASLNEAFDKYAIDQDFKLSQQQFLSRWLIQQITYEYPNIFTFMPDLGLLQDNRTNTQLSFDKDFNLLSIKHNSFLGSIKSGPHAILSLLQEDFCFVDLSEPRDRISFLHLCFPNHWAAKEKIGQSFLQAHDTVPGMHTIKHNRKKLLQSILHKSPFVRFAWGLASNTQLNQHPTPPKNVSKETWYGRQHLKTIDISFLRVERQVCIGLPEQHAMLFFIRTYFYAVNELSLMQRNIIKSAIDSMPDDVLAYKGFSNIRIELFDEMLN